jgi:AcrR family transcriptional regulator
MSQVGEAARGDSADAGAAKAVVGGIVDALCERQRRALLLLTEGKPIGEIAEAVGVNRTTVYRWIRADPHFRAAYNAWQLEQRESCRAALLRSAQGAVAKIVRMIDIDSAVALRVAKELGLFQPSQGLQTDPQRVQREIEVEQLEVEAQLEQRATGGLLRSRATRSRTSQEAAAAVTGPLAPSLPEASAPAAAPVAAAPQEINRQRMLHKQEQDRAATTIG